MEIQSVLSMSPLRISFLGGGTTIFNVRGNEYRLETTIAYKAGTIVVLWIGTHAKYDERNKKR